MLKSESKNPDSSTQAQKLQTPAVTENNQKNSAIANLYALWRMKKGTREFLDDPEANSKYVQEMQAKQDAMAKQVMGPSGPKLAEHFAFIDNKRPYLPSNVPVATLSQPDRLAAKIGKRQHVLITIPINNSGAISQEDVTRNQVYFGKNFKNNTCIYFNNKEAVKEKEGPCDEILNTMAKHIGEAGTKNGHCHVAEAIGWTA